MGPQPPPTPPPSTATQPEKCLELFFFSRRLKPTKNQQTKLGGRSEQLNQLPLLLGVTVVVVTAAVGCLWLVLKVASGGCTFEFGFVPVSVVCGLFSLLQWRFIRTVTSSWIALDVASERC